MLARKGHSGLHVAVRRSMSLVPAPQFALEAAAERAVAFEVVAPLQPKPIPESKLRNLLDGARVRVIL